MHDYIKYTLVALASGGVIGVTAMEFKTTDVKQTTVEKPIGVLTKATTDCLAKVREVGENPICVLGEAYLGQDKTTTKGWLCNGAWMPKATQDCLNEAAKSETGLQEAPPEVKP
jgi:hypothetical protein